VDNGLETSQRTADAHEKQRPIEIRDGKCPFIESYGIVRTYYKNATYTCHGKREN